MSARTDTFIKFAKVLVVAIITIVLFVITINAMRNPVHVSTSSYTADFTDASGLHKNGDVRYKGQRVGKVSNVELHTSSDTGATVAQVSFSLDKNFKVTDSTQLAIKYQNLTGIRYLDFRGGDQTAPRVSHVPVSRTIPSFDITELFNGLQPVLATMRTEDVNQFSENAIALLQGDGTGLGPMLDSTQKLADHAKDREKLISTLVSNLSRISDTMGGKSQNVLGVLHGVDIPVRKAISVLTEFQRTAVTGPEFLSPVHRLLTALGLNENLEVDEFIKAHFKSFDDALTSFERLPNALAGLKTLQNRPGVDQRCSKGRAQIPSDVQILLSGTEVVLCKR